MRQRSGAINAQCLSTRKKLGIVVRMVINSVPPPWTFKLLIVSVFTEYAHICACVEVSTAKSSSVSGLLTIRREVSQ